MKNIKEFSDIDFDALLIAAKAKHKIIIDKCNAHQFDQDPTEFKKTRAEWEQWCQINLTDRGIDMTENAYTGEPLSLSIVVAGSKF